MQCRRAIVPGGTFFFTLVTDRRHRRNARYNKTQKRQAGYLATSIPGVRCATKPIFRHVDHIHYKPLKYDLPCSLMAWLHYGFGRYGKAGVYSLDRGSELMCDEGVGVSQGDQEMSGYAALTRPTYRV